MSQKNQRNGKQEKASAMKRETHQMPNHNEQAHVSEKRRNPYSCYGHGPKKGIPGLGDPNRGYGSPGMGGGYPGGMWGGYPGMGGGYPGGMWGGYPGMGGGYPGGMWGGYPGMGGGYPGGMWGGYPGMGGGYPGGMWGGHPGMGGGYPGGMWGESPSMGGGYPGTGGGYPFIPSQTSSDSRPSWDSPAGPTSSDSSAWYETQADEESS